MDFCKLLCVHVYTPELGKENTRAQEPAQKHSAANREPPGSALAMTNSSSSQPLHLKPGN